MADEKRYSAGNLEFQMQTVSNNAAASFSKVNSQLTTMMNLVGSNVNSFKAIRRTLASIDKIQFNSLDKLNSLMTNLASFSSGNNFKNLSKINKFANGLNRMSKLDLEQVGQKVNLIPNALQPLNELSSIGDLGQFNSFANGLNKIVKIDVEGFNKQITELTASLKPFLEQITVSTPALQTFSSAMSSIKGRRTIKFDKMDNTQKTLDKTLNLGKLLGKLYFIRNYTKQMARNLANIVQYGIDYNETLNLWQVAMRGNREEAEEFISTMNRAYGISSQTLMNYQAIFRNMLSSLGGLSEMTSYALSEYLTQMALDYASLYNTSIEKAMTTFQSVLSGQVRPIRSIAGYDITETTIYQLYQQLGGTKTMRQLSQTEKRLLRIYAVFQQMESSGAISDLNRTLNRSANQLRILNESMKEFETYLGRLVVQWLEPLLPYLNAIIITITRVIKAISGITDPFENNIESVAEYGEAIDEVQGKLLSFDRFEALNSSEDNNLGLGIDEALLAGMEKYQSILQDATNKATELADKWTAWLIEADTGELTEKAQNLLDVLKAIGIALGILIGYKLSTLIVNLIGKIAGLTSASQLLSFTLMTGAVYAIIKAVEAFKEGDTWGGILATTIGVTLVGALISASSQFGFIKNLGIIGWFQNIQVQGALATTTMQKFQVSLGYVGRAALMAFASFSIFDSILGSLDGTAKKVVSIISIVTGALATLLGIILAVKGGLKGGLIGASIAGLGVGALVAGIKNIASKESDLSDITQFKNGGLVEDGRFTMSKGEIIGKFDDGSTIVANNQQITEGIRQAAYSGMAAALREFNINSGGDVYLDRDKVGQIIAKPAHREMLRSGYIKVSS